jgi:putative ABC transport system permease protein
VIQKLVWENVKHRPLRTLLSALLIAVPVTLVLMLVGLSRGMIEESNRRSKGVGADIVIRPKGSSFLTLGSAPIDERLLDKLLRMEPHVTLATGIVVQTLGNPLSSAAGIDLAEFSKMSGGFRYLEGGPFQSPDDVIIDEFYAKEAKAHAGGTLRILNRPWRVSGVVETGKLNRVFIELRKLQDLTGNTGKVNQIYLTVDDRKNIPAVVESLKAKLVDYPIYSMEDFTSLMTADNIPLLSPFIRVMIGISVFIGFAVVCLSMYMAVLQRTREIGILKSLGASKGFVLSIILREAVLMALAGTIIGIIMSFGAKALLTVLVPSSLPTVIAPDWWPKAGGIALAGAVFGALYPGLRAAAQDPIEALSYE